MIQDLIDKNIEQNRLHKAMKRWNASGLGLCKTSRFLERMGVEPDSDFDPRTLRVFEAGKLFEQFVVENVSKVAESFETQIWCEVPELDAGGYADLDVGDLVYEIKSQHSRAFFNRAKTGGKPSIHNIMQLWFYLYARNKKEGRLVYVSKDDLSIDEYQIFLDDPELRDKVLKELEYMNLAWKAQVPPLPPKKGAWEAKLSRYAKQIYSQPQYITEDGEIISNEEMMRRIS